MATYTANYNLKKPELNEAASPVPFNEDLDEIDRILFEKQDSASLAGLLLQKVYPVGSIYMSTTDVSPQTFIGGTWEKIEDRFLLGASATYAAGTKDGEAAHALTVDELASHGHTFTGNVSTTSGQSVSHTHTVNAHSHGLNGHTHAVSGSTGGQSATHTHSGATGTQSANHTHIVASYSGVHDFSFAGGAYGEKIPSTYSNVDSAGISVNHTHAFTTGNASSDHTHAFNVTSGGNSGSTTNTSPGTGGASSDHTHTVTAAGTVVANGSGTAHNNMPPYLAVYMWKRVA